MKNNGLRASYWQKDDFMVLDQLLLPGKIVYIQCSTFRDVVSVIVDMNLRGAPLIGAAASAGAALFFKECKDHDTVLFSRMVEELLSTRPTAVNLGNVLDEAKAIYKENISLDSDHLFNMFRDFSINVHTRDVERNIAMGRNGAQFVADLLEGKKLNILTHCNAGALATCGYGTALGVIRSLHDMALVENVWVDETRPYLQGARITAFELDADSIPHKIITDSTAAHLMSQNLVDVVITGADRVALNGDLANKIGTYSLAVNARYHNIPFISAMPVETFDMFIKSGKEIEIEKRSDRELLVFNGKRIAPENSEGLHLGFDVVPAELTTALVTEKGVVSPVSTTSVMEMIYG